jgi:hypothetical protein
LFVLWTHILSFKCYKNSIFSSVSLFIPHDNDKEQAPGGGIKHHIVDSTIYTTYRIDLNTHNMTARDKINIHMHLFQNFCFQLGNCPLYVPNITS